MEPLAKPAIEAVNSGRVRFVPERFTKVYLNWMENIRDWCISRQLWLGHPIPVWYCHDCDGLTVTVLDPEVCQHCGSKRIERDPDVLDTWFSSALWPHSTLGWPDETADLRYFYPTSVMETGYDIIFFWVARMIMMGLYNMKEIPFHTVYLHGLVRDERGEKISKSKVTTKHHIPSPIEAIETYGADALRYALSTAGTPGNDLRISEQRIEAGRNFANKFWNAARFVTSRLEGRKVARPALEAREAMALEDRWIMSRLNTVVTSVDQLMADFQLGEAGRQAHDFLWGEYCDWYLEMAKVRLVARDDSPLPVLAHVLDQALRLLHPFMPYVTEAAWRALSPHLADSDAEALIVAPFPQADARWLDEGTEKSAKFHIDTVQAIRNLRAQYGVEPGRFVPATVVINDTRLEVRGTLIEALARARPLDIVMQIKDGMAVGEAPSEGVVTTVLEGAHVILPMAGLFDLEAERGRLEKQLAASEAEVERLQARLADEQFRSRAPEAVVQRERDKLAATQARSEGLRQRLAELG
jgi:valyl-tRNA synthetase